MEPSVLLQKRGLPRLSMSKCPECRKPFLAATGYVFECEYTRSDTNEAEQGYMIFCSALCALQWPNMTQLKGVM